MRANEQENKTGATLSTRDITQIGLATALIIVCSQISIPMPGGVPMTLQTLIIPLAAIVLGTKRGVLATVIYLLLGLVGLPVFSGFRGGPGMLFGLTGGFLLSFPFLAALTGWGTAKGRPAPAAWGLLAGTVVNYLIGMGVFALVSGSGMMQAFYACVLPFLPTTAIKMALTLLLGWKLRETLRRALP